MPHRLKSKALDVMSTQLSQADTAAQVLWHRVRASLVFYVAGFGCVFTLTSLELALPQVFRGDTLTVNIATIQQWLQSVHLATQMLLGGAILLFIFLSTLALRWGFGLASIKDQLKLKRLVLSNTVRATTSSNHTRNPRLLVNFMSDTTAVSQLSGSFALQAFTMIITTALLIGLMLMESWHLTLVFALVLALASVVLLLIRNRFSYFYHQSQQEQQAYAHLVNQAAAQANQIRAQGLQLLIKKNIASSLQRFMRFRTGYVIEYLRNDLRIELVGGFALALIFAYICIVEPRQTRNELVSFCLYAFLFLVPLGQAADLLAGAKRIYASFKRLEGSSTNKRTSTLGVAENFVILPDEPAIFPTNLRENLNLGRPIADEMLNQLLAVLELDVEFKRQGIHLDTELNWSDGRLSGGQKQRLHLGRVILTKPNRITGYDLLHGVDVEQRKRILRRIQHQYSGISFALNPTPIEGSHAR